jgi:hypothetical protein
MKFDQYAASASTEQLVYQFVSSGPKGNFPKIIQYSYIHTEGGQRVANLGFGLLKDDGTVDDTFRTSNGDTHKILATVANTILSFTEKYPDIPVFATGSDPVRTRLYRRMLNLNKDEIEKIFIIYGRKDNLWHTFELNIDYDAFLIVRKKMLILIVIILLMMKNSKKITPKNGRSITIDNTLDRFNGKVLFEKKVALASAILAQSPFPDALKA